VSTTPGAVAPTFRLLERGSPFVVPVRNREFLAGSTDINVPETIPDAGAMIPVREPEHTDCSPAQLAAASRAVIDETLPVAGGVQLRGLGLADKAAFERFIGDLGYPAAGYEGGIAVRKNDAGLALNASQEDRRITLAPHNEMAYLPSYPRKIFFFCESEATLGGEVPVNDIRETIAVLPERVKDDFRREGIRYHRNLPRESAAGEMGWVDTFRTDEKRLVERAVGPEYEVGWGDGDRLHYSYRHSAFVAHPETGEELWFNQVTELHCSYWRSHPDFPGDLADHDYPATTTYGSGKSIDETLISFLRAALWQTARAVKMRRGDVLILDNQVLQHGRFSFEGPRRHFVSLAR
jgi:alpha-ketoglutarate-dependent taurine dioxygenase